MPCAAYDQSFATPSHPADCIVFVTPGRPYFISADWVKGRGAELNCVWQLLPPAWIGTVMSSRSEYFLVWFFALWQPRQRERDGGMRGKIKEKKWRRRRDDADQGLNKNYGVIGDDAGLDEVTLKDGWNIFYSAFRQYVLSWWENN